MRKTMMVLSSPPRVARSLRRPPVQQRLRHGIDTGSDMGSDTARAPTWARLPAACSCGRRLRRRSGVRHRPARVRARARSRSTRPASSMTARAGGPAAATRRSPARSTTPPAPRSRRTSARRTSAPRSINGNAWAIQLPASSIRRDRHARHAAPRLGDHHARGEPAVRARRQGADRHALRHDQGRARRHDRLLDRRARAHARRRGDRSLGHRAAPRSTRTPI